MQHTPITIVGAGPIGLTTALKIAEHGHSVTVLDAGNSKANDGRVLALSYASYATLDHLGCWPQHLATAINQVHISHNGLGVSHILAKDVNLEQLGFTIKYADICSALLHKITDYPQIKLHTAEVNTVVPGQNYATVHYSAKGVENYLTTDLAILAEGGKINLSKVNYTKIDYGQTAIIAQLAVQKPHHNIAFERFEAGGPLVLLPYQDNYVLVWSMAEERAQSIMLKQAIKDELTKFSFMKRFGSIEIIGMAHSFPLSLQVAKQRVLDRVILIGNSAQIVHPVSAQGMNLGLRDAHLVGKVIAEAFHLSDLDYISNYEQLRQADAGFVTKFTHFLAKFLEQQAPLIQHARGIGIMGLSNCKPLQNYIANSLIFGI